MAATENWDPEEAHRRQKEQQEEAAAVQMGASQAQGLGAELMSKEFVDEVTDPDIDRDLPDDDPAQHNLKDLMGSHLSKQLALGYISKDDYEREREMNKGRKLLMKQQFRSTAGGGGCECTGRTRERMTGGSSESRQELSEDMDAQIDGAFEVKDAMMSGAVDGQRSKSVTEAHVVTRNESNRSSSEEKGLIGRATSKIFG